MNLMCYVTVMCILVVTLRLHVYVVGYSNDIFNNGKNPSISNLTRAIFKLPLCKYKYSEP